MKMVSLKISKNKAALRAALAPAAVEESGPRYPWGLEIHLDKEVLDRIGINLDDHDVGEPVMFHAVAKVTTISKRDTTSGGERSMSLQITDIGWEGMHEE